MTVDTAGDGPRIGRIIREIEGHGQVDELNSLWCVDS